MKILTAVFCILAALCVAAAIPVFCYFGLVPMLVCVGGAFLFAILMLLCKNGFPKKKPSEPDFLHPKDKN